MFLEGSKNDLATIWYDKFYRWLTPLEYFIIWMVFLFYRLVPLLLALSTDYVACLGHFGKLFFFHWNFATLACMCFLLFFLNWIIQFGVSTFAKLNLLFVFFSIELVQCVLHFIENSKKKISWILVCIVELENLSHN